MNKKLILFFATIGGLLGGYAPVLLGNNDFALSIFTGTIGGLLGIWLGAVIAKRVG